MEYYTEEAKKELERRKAEAEALAQAWAHVERKYKKNGEEFARIAQNFAGLNFINKYNEDYMQVTCFYNGKYYSDEYSIDKTIYNNSTEAEEYKKQGRLIDRGQFLHPYIKLNAEEIEAFCKNLAEYYQNYADELAENLEEFEETAARLVALREECKRICKECKGAKYVMQTIYKESRI